MTIREVAMELMVKSNCNLDCYKHDEKNYALKDMNEAYPDGYAGFTNAQIAAELQKIGDEQPDPPHPQWKVHWETDDCVDAHMMPVDWSFNAAKESALDTLIEWQMEFICDKHIRDEEQLKNDEELRDDWNYMIDTCSVSVWRYDPEFVAEVSDHDLDKYYHTDERDGWYLYWEPSDEDLEQIGWKEIE